MLPLCLREARSPPIRAAHKRDTDMAVWWATRTECVSALCRLTREPGGPPDKITGSHRKLDALCETWMEVRPSEAVRSRAERLLAVHSLRTADAFQLAAALQWCEEDPSGVEIVTLDRRLGDAARAEGFTVLP